MKKIVGYALVALLTLQSVPMATVYGQTPEITGLSWVVPPTKDYGQGESLQVCIEGTVSKDHATVFHWDTAVGQENYGHGYFNFYEANVITDRKKNVTRNIAEMGDPVMLAKPQDFYAGGYIPKTYRYFVLDTEMVPEEGQFSMEGNQGYRPAVTKEMRSQWSKYPVESLKRAKFAIMKADGWATDFVFDDIRSSGFTSKTDLAPVKKDGKWGFVDWDGNFVISNQYEDAKPFAGNDGRALAAVKKNGKWGFIDEKGADYIPFVFEDTPGFADITMSGTEEGNGLVWRAFVKYGGKWGIIDMPTEPLVPVSPVIPEEQKPQQPVSTAPDSMAEAQFLYRLRYFERPWGEVDAQDRASCGLTEKAYAQSKMVMANGEVCYAPELEILQSGKKTALKPIDPSYKFLMINGVLINDPKVVMKGGRTLVPLRLVGENLGAETAWEGDSKKITIRKHGTEVQLKLHETTATVDGKVVKLDTPATIIGGKTYVPLRFIGDAFGAAVGYQTKFPFEIIPVVWIDTVDAPKMSVDAATKVVKEKTKNALDGLLAEESRESLMGGASYLDHANGVYEMMEELQCIDQFSRFYVFTEGVIFDVYTQKIYGMRDLGGTVRSIYGGELTKDYMEAMYFVG